MNIEKLKSGSYRITQMVQGRRYRATVDHKPTATEAMKIISGLVDRAPVGVANKTLRQACQEYLEAKSEVLSPPTIRGYYYLAKLIDDEYLDKRLNQLTAVDLQKIINKVSLDHSYKTLKNLRSHIMSVLNMFDIKLKSPTLPQPEAKDDPYIPTKDDVKRVLKALQGSKFDCAIQLAVMGVRRSEICALEVTDLSEDNVLFICKAMVQTKNGDFVIRHKTKTDKSTRKIVLVPHIADLIREQGFVYIGHPNSILDGLKAVEKRLGIPYFSPHKMRHFFVSYLHDLGYSDEQIMAMGGWKTDHVLKTVYRHAMEMEEAKKSAAIDLGELWDPYNKDPSCPMTYDPYLIPKTDSDKNLPTNLPTKK